MNFFTISNPRPLKIRPSASRSVFKPSYTMKVNEHGIKYLEKTGETDIFEEVQMFRDECNIYNIIRRYELGDTSVLRKVNSQYIDTLGQPKTMQEALNLAVKLKSNFNSLKPEVKAQFNNDFNSFLSSVADGTVINVLKSFEKPVKNEIKEETHNE